MGESYLSARLTALRRAQNPDGGWGYFAGKQSWLEPTFYAALALHGEATSDRAWTLLKSWQQPDGAWRPSKDVQIAHWDTALCVTFATVRGEYGDAFHRGVDWLLNSAGVESSLFNRAAAKVGLLEADRDLSFKGWPWKPDTSSWVEPTAHTLVALKRAAPKITASGVSDRVRLGEAQLFDVRCRDAGWNYGSRAALGVDLPSYPETTALALLGLQGHPDLANSLRTAERMAAETKSPMASAWLTIALRLHGVSVQVQSASPVVPDLLITAIEALGAPEGNYKSLSTGAKV